MKAVFVSLHISFSISSAETKIPSVGIFTKRLLAITTRLLAITRRLLINEGLMKAYKASLHL